MSNRGTKGPIYATYATQKITEVILQDSAKIQSEDFDRAVRKAKRAGREHEVEAPLYEPKDIDGVLELFKRVEFGDRLELNRNVSATFHPAGHILGSAFIVLDGSSGRVILSGDLGNRESSLQADFALPGECDAVLVETTYGDRTHRPEAATIEEFRTVIQNAAARGGKIMIPSFALERTQVVLHQLKVLEDAGEIEPLPIFLDSPMATKFTKLYQECANEFLPEIRAQLAQGRDPFEPPTLQFTVTTEESKKINSFEGATIIVAGSGMMTGGRILHHLKHNLWKDNASLVVVGYQASGSLGRSIVDGADHVRIYGDDIRVRADIHTIGGFSAHADQDDLLAWLAPTGAAPVYMIHGEVPTMNTFGDVLVKKGRKPIIVKRNEPYELS